MKPLRYQLVRAIIWQQTYYKSWIYISCHKSRYQVFSYSQISWHSYLQCWTRPIEVVNLLVICYILLTKQGGMSCVQGVAEILLMFWCLSSDYMFQSCICSSCIVSRTIEGSLSKSWSLWQVYKCSLIPDIKTLPHQLPCLLPSPSWSISHLPRLWWSFTFLNSITICNWHLTLIFYCFEM